MFQEETNSTGTDWNLTYNYSKAIDFMDDRPTYYDSSNFNSNYEDYLEVNTPVSRVVFAPSILACHEVVIFPCLSFSFPFMYQTVLSVRLL